MAADIYIATDGSGFRRAEVTQNLHEALKMYRLIFDHIECGMIVTDADGYITHFNESYGRFLGIDPQRQIGRHCTEVLETSRMHIVAKTGVSEINHLFKIREHEMVVQRIPIRKDGAVVAVVGLVLFRNIRDVGKLARELADMESKIRLYEAELANLRSTRYTFESIIGTSDAIRSLKQEALKATGNKFPVLILGESGTGKELFAQAIHQMSDRQLHPFVRINCAAIPRDLLEAELFGYEKGAFTGARSTGKPGKFELGHRGTVFLDEIGDLPLEMQPKLLRVLEEKEFERLGGTKVIRPDFRLIAATNQPLEAMIDDGRFRKDLYYRLNVIHLKIPPLRERREDIPETARSLLVRLAEEASLSPPDLAPDAEQLLTEYDWPGNVRELANVVERILSGLEGSCVRPQDLPFHIRRLQTTDRPLSGTPIRAVRDDAEKSAIAQALRETGYNKAESARLLGIHRTQLYKKLKRYGIPLIPESLNSQA
ncbi:MAG: sigma-54 interaction domain-containing protein [Desulfobacterales bacterium]